jgi:hypothetical protein
MKTKHIILAVGGGVVLCGFGAFVLILAFLLTIGEHVEREEAGKLTIAVRHKMIYYGGVPSSVQCVLPQIGVCETPATWNREKHIAGGSRCKIRGDAPQPFFRQPDVSDFDEYEFDLAPGETYYWYVHFENDDRCFGWLPAEIERFETGEIKMAQKEAKRIEFDFTK